MKYAKMSWLSLSLVLVVAGTAAAQQPPKKRPMKNPPQYPHILGTEAQPAPTAAPEKAEPAPAAGLAPNLSAQQSELLIRAVQSLAGEVRSLVQEMRALNMRQQAQLDVLRITRADFHVEQYTRELKATRDRLAQLESDEQNLTYMAKPDSLLAQTQHVGTLDRDATMRQLKATHEARLRAVAAEKELLQKREAELVVVLDAYRNTNTDAERRIQQAEEMIRRLDGITAEPQREAPPEAGKP